MQPTLPATPLHTLATHTGPINALTFSAIGGTYILTGSSDRNIHLCRTTPSSACNGDSPATTTKPIQAYSAHGYAVLSLTCAADNQTFASAGGDRSVFLWDVSTATTVRRFGSNTSQGHSARIGCVSFAGDEDSVLVSGSADRSVRLWDCRSRNANPIMVLDDAKDSVSCLAVPRTGVEIVAGSVDGSVRSYDVRAGCCTVDTLPAAVTSVEVTRDAKVLLVSCLDSRIRMLDRKDGTCLQTLQGAGYVNEELRLQSCFGLGEAVVLAGSETDGKVRAWDVVSGGVAGEVEASEGGKVVSVIAWRDNSRSSAGTDGVWACGGVDGKARVYGKR